MLLCEVASLHSTRVPKRRAGIMSEAGSGDLASQVNEEVKVLHSSDGGPSGGVSSAGESSQAGGSGAGFGWAARDMIP